MTGGLAHHHTISLRGQGPFGEVTCLVNPEGASLEGLRVGQLELIERFAEGTPRPLSAGVTLAPWPNRVRDGLWEWENQRYELEITEPARHNAIHGLVTERIFDEVALTDDRVTLRCRIEDKQGYPFALDVEVEYRLSASGIIVVLTVTNLGESRAPVALGAHPYLCVGDAPIRSLTLRSPVAAELAVDQQMIPLSSRAIAPSSGLPIGMSLAEAELDSAFRLSGEGPWTTQLIADDGGAVELWQERSMPWIQLFITDSFPGINGVRSALAVEPMTAPPNAFVSGDGVVAVEPGESWSVRWGINRLS
jgi:aldose 1-epimerase